mmetsp:Transcript_34967/g.73763  ORF Transcript_34967/g.73763 Transcript_34967/m.73763 type:complete len:652 (-) Transcript_34967:19-1974(-)
MKNFSCLIMATVQVTTRANLMMGVRASRASIRSGIGGSSSTKQRHFPCDFPCGDVVQRLPNLHIRAVSSNSMAFVSSPSQFQRRYEQLPTPPTTTSQSSLVSFGRCATFHSTTTLMMGKRKKSGAKRKKGVLKTKPQSKPKEAETNGTMEPALTNNADDLNSILEDAEQDDLAPEFTATFASEYHAPVMPTECIDALLKQGEWGEMLAARKERWRKKRSILEAKRRRLEMLEDEDDQEEDEESGVEDASGNGEASSSTSDEITDGHPPRLFVDGTLGGGGHSQALLQQMRAGDVLIGCDVDPEALSTASTRLKEYLATCDYILDQSNEQPTCEWGEEKPMFIPVQSNFRNLIAVLSKVRHPATGRYLLGNREDGTNLDHDDDGVLPDVEFPRGVNGLLLDLGVSSHQIDTSERGFAFMKEGPLDMRMSGNDPYSQSTAVGSSALTAADICNEFDEAALIDILRTYGDEPRARRVAGAIVSSRPLHTTTDLVHAINSVTPTFARQKRAGLIATSARVFQALRIAVNEEDGALKEVLERVAPWALARSGYSLRGKSGGGGVMDEGILVVLSYHSMEDKMAKRVIRDGKVDLFERSSRRRGGSVLEKDIYGNVIDESTFDVPFEPLAKQRKATEEEIAVNSRSRSATLRVAIRI